MLLAEEEHTSDVRLGRRVVRHAYWLQSVIRVAIVRVSEVTQKYNVKL